MSNPFLYQLIIKIQDIYRRAYSGHTGSDLLAAWTQPDVQLPRAGVSIRTIGTYLRNMLGRRSTEISGAIVRDGEDNYTLLLRVVRADSPSAQIVVPVDRTSRNMLGDAHEKAVQIVDRHLYGLYQIAANSPDRANAIRSIVLGPDSRQDAWMHYYHGVLAADSGDPLEAMKSFGIALETERNLIDALIDWGVVLSEKGMFRAAIEKYSAAIAVAPSNPVLRVNLADAYMSVRDYDAAEKQLVTAMNTDPDFVHAQLRYATFLLITGREHEGEDKFRAVVEDGVAKYKPWLYGPIQRRTQIGGKTR